MAATKFPNTINEHDSCEVVCPQLTKEDGSVLGSASMQALTLTYYDLETGTILNGLDGVDILNTSRGTLTVGGVLTIALEPLDNPIITTTNAKEKHKGLIEMSWNNGKGGKSQEFIITVINVNLVP